MLVLAPPIAAGIALGEGRQVPRETSQTRPEAADSAASDLNRPLPDIPILMHEVEAQQRASEAIQKNYVYRSVETLLESNSHGVKKTEVNQYDVLWINGVQVRRLLMKNGKELSEDERKKEDERLDKESARMRERRDRAEAAGRQTSPRGDEEVTVSRILELGRFSNAHRVVLHGRDTIVVDYTGDRNAKPRNSFENVIRDLVGTVWVDEQDHAIAKLQGHFVDNFKIGGGLLVNIHKGFRFSMEQVRVNNEVWFPASVSADGSARILLFRNVNGSIRVADSDYRKFKTDSTIVSAGSHAVDGPAQPSSETTSDPPK
jgi:hypothetical protein